MNANPENIINEPGAIIIELVLGFYQLGCISGHFFFS